jgi:hypothetical protein
VPEDKELWDMILSICTKADLSTLTMRMVRLLLLTVTRYLIGIFGLPIGTCE